jgi:thymidylate synthase
MSSIGSGLNFYSMDDVQRWAFANLLESDLRSAPRGVPTRELLGQSFTLVNPRARMINAPARRWSLPLALGEFCWHVSASNDVEVLAYYAPRWREFTEDGRTVRGSCYGKRIFGHEVCGSSVWDSLLVLLHEDPASRRAVIDLSRNGQLNSEAVDVSCTSTLQFFIRNGLVHLIVQMRSNDAVWGLPYDVFLFTMIQEMLAVTLGLEMGSYVHGVGSLHLYDRHVELAHRVLAEPLQPVREMQKMGPASGLAKFLIAERAIRSGGKVPPLSAYWEELAEALRTFSTVARGRPPAVPT